VLHDSLGNQIKTPVWQKAWAGGGLLRESLRLGTLHCPIERTEFGGGEFDPDVTPEVLWQDLLYQGFQKVGSFGEIRFPFRIIVCFHCDLDLKLIASDNV